MADSSDVPSSPFESHHRSALARLAPFAAVAIVAELSLALPPGPASSPDTYVSVLFLALTAAALMLPKKLPDGSTSWRHSSIRDRAWHSSWRPEDRLRAWAS